MDHIKTKSQKSSHITVHKGFGVFRVSESFPSAVCFEDQHGCEVHLEPDAFLNKFSADRVEGSPHGTNCRWNVRSDMERLIVVLKLTFASSCGQNFSDVSRAMNLDNNRARPAIWRRTQALSVRGQLRQMGLATQAVLEWKFSKKSMGSLPSTDSLRLRIMILYRLERPSRSVTFSVSAEFLCQPGASARESVAAATSLMRLMMQSTFTSSPDSSLTKESFSIFCMRRPSSATTSAMCFNRARCGKSGIKLSWLTAWLLLALA